LRGRCPKVSKQKKPRNPGKARKAIRALVKEVQEPDHNDNPASFRGRLICLELFITGKGHLGPNGVISAGEKGGGSIGYFSEPA